MCPCTQEALSIPAECWTWGKYVRTLLDCVFVHLYNNEIDHNPIDRKWIQSIKLYLFSSCWVSDTIVSGDDASMTKISIPPLMHLTENDCDFHRELLYLCQLRSILLWIGNFLISDSFLIISSLVQYVFTFSISLRITFAHASPRMKLTDRTKCLDQCTNK